MDIFIGGLLWCIGVWSLMWYRKLQNRFLCYAGVSLIMLGTALALWKTVFDYAMTPR